MEWLILSFLIISTCLFALSFLVTKKETSAKEDVEQLSMTMMAEVYQLKKKLNVLEEELLHETTLQVGSTQFTSDQLQEEVISWFRAGYSVEEIATEMELTPDEVRHFLARLP
ncbi:hypothetical protein [Salsuginibacillus kocurii]|uniref:hypothetical protein n=1 Tax=Salsuginibacillus kocurii TaxID=427078 RepID=UPI0003601614|nr:hypothetical protein [Salsuginibacillus kocurii]